MTWDELKETAVISAERYYDFLDREGKGVVETGISKVAVLKSGFVKLTLSATLFSADDLQVKIHNKPYAQDQIKPTHYDKDENALFVRPRDELLHLFYDLAPHEIVVISDLKFLVKRVRDWYAFRREPLHLPTLFPCITPDMPELSAKPSLEQLTAFEGIFRSPLSYVWGAPGTGKTQFVLARAVLAYCRAKKRVLIAAPTNNAVEQTLKGVLAVLQEAGIPFDKVLRLGTPSKEFYDRYPMVCEVRAVEDELEELNKQIAFYQKALAYFEARDWFDSAENIFLVNTQKIRDAYNEISALEKKSESLKANLNLTQAGIAPVISAINELTAKKTSLGAYLNKERSRFSIWLHKSALEKARTDLESVDHRLQLHAAEHAQILAQCKELQRQINSIARERIVTQSTISDACFVIRGIPPCPFPSDFTKITSSLYPTTDVAQFVSDALDSLANIKQILGQRAEFYRDTTPEQAKASLAALSKRKADLDQRSVSNRLSNCYVVAATVDGCISRLPSSDYLPEHVFLDEAAYCPLIKGATLLSYGAPFTLFGDHMQLPPVCEMNNDKFRDPHLTPVCLWAQSTLNLCDLFEMSLDDIFRNYKDDVPPQFVRMTKYDLLHTYRFGEDLARVLGRFIYTNKFRGNPSIETNILVIDVPKSSSDAKHTNPAECDAIKRFLISNPLSNYAILAPFRKQRALLSKVFPQDTVFTIHGSQGREWDTVFLSVTVTSQNWFLKPRLINTAVSRAKKRLIIVCDESYWRSRQNHIIGGLVEAASTHI